MWKDIIRKWNCRRFGPLLTAYAEGQLDAARRDPLEAHLDACEDCQEQLALLAETGDMLRAYPPAVPELSPDLWARIRAEINAEPAPLPVRAPERRVPTGIAWRSFGTAFVGSGTLVAAAAVGVVLVTQPLMRREREARITARKAADDTALLAKTTGSPDGRTVSGITLEVRKGPLPTRVALAPESAKPAPTLALKVATSVARPERVGRPLRRPRSRRPMLMAVVTPAIAAPAAVSVAAPAFMKSDAVPARPRRTASGEDELPAGSVRVAVETGGALPPAAEASVAPREVPAPRSAAAVAVRMRSQQVLFTYTGR